MSFEAEVQIRIITLYSVKNTWLAPRGMQMLTFLSPHHFLLVVISLIDGNNRELVMVRGKGFKNSQSKFIYYSK